MVQKICSHSFHLTPTTFVSLHEQHERLYPDRRIDELADCGIADLKVYAAAVRSSNRIASPSTIFTTALFFLSAGKHRRGGDPSPD